MLIGQCRGAIYHASRHLREEQLLPAFAGCPLCAGEERAEVGRLQANPTVTLLECRHCRGVSASRMPLDTVLADYYGDYYESGGGPDGRERATFDGVDRLARHVYTHAGSTHWPSVLRVLDFGGGDGSVAVELARIFLDAGGEGASVSVVDYNERLCEVADPRIRLARIERLDDTPDHSFDVVLASAILEHIPQPIPVFESLLGKLDDRGTFYARTPYVMPLKRMLGVLGIDLDFTFPGHVHDLGQPFWDPVLETFGLDDRFERVRSRPSIVETTLERHFVRTIAARLMKLPWRLFGRRWGLVGGWEIFIRRRPAARRRP